jgi:hypothetical protein
MRGLTLLWSSFVEPVCWNLFHSLEMVLWLTFRVRSFIRFSLTVDLSTNHEIHVDRFQQTGSTNDDQRSVRPRIATHGKDRYIWVFHLRNRTIAVSITATGILGMRRTSSQTVRNRLRQHGIRPIRPFFGEVLMPLHLREIVR